MSATKRPTNAPAPPKTPDVARKLPKPHGDHTPQPTPKQRAPRKPALKPKKNGRPTVWTPEVEQTIITTLETTGCSFRDAAEVAGINYETLKARQRLGDSFAALIARTKLLRKTNALSCIQRAIADGDWRAANTWLAVSYPEEFARDRVLPAPPPPPSGAAVTNVNVTLVQQLVAEPDARSQIGSLVDRLRLAAERDRASLASAAGALRHVDASGRDAADPGPAPQRHRPGSARGRSG